MQIPRCRLRQQVRTVLLTNILHSNLINSHSTIGTVSTSGSLNNADHLSFRPHFSEIFRRVQEIVDVLKDLHVLIYLDNAESPLTACPKHFRELLTRLFESNPKVYILVSSRNSIGGGIPGTAERVYTLCRLSATVSAELLCRSARDDCV